MFKIINLDSDNIVIVEASGKISKQDYIDVLVPFLDKIKDEGKRVKFLFRTDVDFDGYTVGAAWEDFKVGVHHFRTIEKCAIVSDVVWFRNVCKFFAPLIPCLVKIFDNEDFEEAKKWLASDRINLNCHLDEENSLLTVEIKDALSEDDFKILVQIVDPFIAKNGNLKGIILHVKQFPYWENLNGLVSHFSFVKNHHRKIKKVALVADGILPGLVPKLAKHFIKAEIKHFAYDELKEGKSWILD